MVPVYARHGSRSARLALARAACDLAADDARRELDAALSSGGGSVSVPLAVLGALRAGGPVSWRVGYLHSRDGATMRPVRLAPADVVHDVAARSGAPVNEYAVSAATISRMFAAALRRRDLSWGGTS